MPVFFCFLGMVHPGLGVWGLRSPVTWLALGGPAVARFSRSLYIPDELGSVCPGVSLAPFPVGSGRAALLLGQGRGNECFEPSLPPKLYARFRLRSASGSNRRRSVLELARAFVKPSNKALLSAHAPTVGRVTATATAAGIVVRAVVSSKRASSAASGISGCIAANGVIVTIASAAGPFRSRKFVEIRCLAWQQLTAAASDYRACFLLSPSC